MIPCSRGLDQSPKAQPASQVSSHMQARSIPGATPQRPQSQAPSWDRAPASPPALAGPRPPLRPILSTAARAMKLSARRCPVPAQHLAVASLPPEDNSWAPELHGWLPGTRTDTPAPLALPAGCCSPGRTARHLGPLPSLPHPCLGPGSGCPLPGVRFPQESQAPHSLTSIRRLLKWHPCHQLTATTWFAVLNQGPSVPAAWHSRLSLSIIFFVCFSYSLHYILKDNRIYLFSRTVVYYVVPSFLSGP